MVKLFCKPEYKLQARSINLELLADFLYMQLEVFAKICSINVLNYKSPYFVAIKFIGNTCKIINSCNYKHRVN